MSSNTLDPSFFAKPINVWNNALATCHSTIARWTPYEFAGLLTLLLLVFYPYWSLGFPRLIQLFLVAGLLYRPLLSSSLAWFAVAALATVIVARHWHPVANHKFLTTYWLWVLAFTHWASDSGIKNRIFIFNARFLVMFTMFGACLQKLLSPTYMDSSFFEMALLTESYFQPLLAITGVDPHLRELTNQTISAIQNPAVTLTAQSVTLPVSAFYGGLAVAVTFWNLAIQFVLELLGFFNQRKVQIAFHILMLAFINITYIAAPFIGFGWLICILCYSFSASTFPRLSLAYLASMLALVMYESPWRDLFV
jgi:hypothetical protein